jgi:electron transfer flavoprotein alpha subunit
MAVLVVAEHDNASLKDATNKLVSAAQKMTGDVDVLVAGSNCAAPAAAAAKIAGVRKVLAAEGPLLAQQSAEALEALIVPLMSNYEAVLFPASTTGKNAAPRIAAKLDLSQVSGVIGIEGADTFVRTTYAGNALVTVKDAQSKHVLTVQPTAFKAAPNGDASVSVENVAAPAGPFKSSFVSEEMAKSDRPELTAAKRVVSGGRAMGSAEEFHKVIEPLADKIGAAVGASRAAVDAGYAPNDYQVGQTGKVVAPELYLAIGISGAIQHLAGMKDSKVIAAINKDEEAPIFAIADYGWVTDYKTAIPELMAELTKAGL